MFFRSKLLLVGLTSQIGFLEAKKDRTGTRTLKTAFRNNIEKLTREQFEFN